jgi:hypothetical protein
MHRVVNPAAPTHGIKRCEQRVLRLVVSTVTSRDTDETFGKSAGVT